MAPNVSVPMNFGIRLLNSPTHSTLELKASQGAVVRASSVILSFNSTVIDHMTTTLHLTSVDMEEFSVEAVRYFVDACYPGLSPDVTRDMFRDINKLANVFKMNWLSQRLAEQFTSIAESIQEVSYQDFFFLFEEAVFVLKETKSRQFVEIVFTKIRSLSGEKDFVSNYISENMTSLTRDKVELIVELAGANVAYVIEPVTQHLVGSVSEGEEMITDNCKLLLDNCDLYQCQRDNPTVSEQLFDVLEQVCLSQENFKWLFRLQRKIIQRSTQPAVSQKPPEPVQDLPGSSEIEAPAGSGNPTEGGGTDVNEEQGNLQDQGNVQVHVEEFRIPSKHVWYISSNIPRIQALTNTRVIIREENLVRITGTRNEVEVAAEFVRNP